MSLLAPNRKPISRYQPRAREVPALPPRWRPPAMWEVHRPDIPLWRFVFLSMLLHALGILLFGAPAGGSREGRAMWGSLDVVIRDSFREPGPELHFDRALRSLRTAPLPPVRASEPPAARMEPAPKIEPMPKVEPLPREAQPAPPVIERLERAIEPPAFEVPKPAPLIEAPRIETRMAEPPRLEPLPPPKPIDIPRIEAPVVPRVERQMAEPPKLEPLPMPKPIDIPRIEAPVVPRIERQMAEPPRIEAPPLPPPKPIEVPRLEAPAVPRVERQMAEPPKIEAPVAQPVEAAPAPRIESAPVPRVAAPPAPKEAPAQMQSTPASMPQRATSPEPAVPSPASESAPRIESAPAAPAPSPFRAPPSKAGDYDPTAPSLDLDAMRKRAGELTRAGTGNRAALPFPMPPVEKPKTKMQDAIEKARKPDCRTAYQALGLAAVVPLIANEFGEGTCRW